MKKIILILLAVCSLQAQEIPADELQVNFNGYFDTFSVLIAYPTISLNKQVSENMSITGRYLVDVISAASMRSDFDVDGITSATSKNNGGGDDNPDEIRHETGLGVTRMLGSGTISLNGLYSTEHDYNSSTLAGSITYPFAKKNTIITLGVVRSWDKVYPQTRDWKRDKNVLSINGGMTQIFSKRLLGQVDVSYSRMEGMLSDAYQVVSVVFPGESRAVNYEPIHPSERIRRAVGLRLNYRTGANSAIQTGYRYYWDTWDVTSHTVHGLYQRHFHNKKMTLSLGVRYYTQGRAYFYEEAYTSPQPLMAVDSKLDSGNSQEYQFKLRINGEMLNLLPIFSDEHVDFSFKFNFYRRHTTTVDWHARTRDLYAIITSFGFRYHF